MTSGANYWIAVSDKPQKRKRADIACELCHSKKIKCDLAVKLTQQLSACSNCSQAGRECRKRISQRANSGRRPKSSKLANVHSSDNYATQSNMGTPNFPFSPPNNDLTSLPMPLPTIDSTTNDHPIPPPLPAHRLSMSTPSGLARANSMHSTVSPNQESTASRFDQAMQTDTGYNSIYAIENSNDARNQESDQTFANVPNSLDDFPDLHLQQGFIETYYEYCYTWCPVIDRSTLRYAPTTSAMLANALALVGSHIKPPLLGAVKPEVYYNRARRKFYEDEEPDTLTAMKALSLFYWWSPRPPSTVHRQ